MRKATLKATLAAKSAEPRPGNLLVGRTAPQRPTLPHCESRVYMRSDGPTSLLGV